MTTTIQSSDAAQYMVAPAVQSDDEILAHAERILLDRLRVKRPIFDALTGARPAMQYVRHHLALAEREAFGVLFLDNKHRVLAVEDLFWGTVNSSEVHPREIVKRALHHNAAAAIIYHNHPSGDPEPSTADERLTRRIKDILSGVDVTLLDHLIVGSTDVLSFAERGLL